MAAFYENYFLWMERKSFDINFVAAMMTNATNQQNLRYNFFKVFYNKEFDSEFYVTSLCKKALCDKDNILAF